MATTLNWCLPSKAFIQSKNFKIMTKFGHITCVAKWSKWHYATWLIVVRFWFFLLWLTEWMVFAKIRVFATIIVIKILQLWRILMTNDFRHYIQHYIRTKSWLGNRKRAPKNQRLGFLESLGPRQWESERSAMTFWLFLLYVVNLCRPSPPPPIVSKWWRH